jgi:hypothetical protein
VFQSVDTGATHGQEVEVVANLDAGTTIVSRGAAMLQEGDDIRIVESKEAELDSKTDNTSDGAGRSPAAGSGVAG